MSANITPIIFDPTQTTITIDNLYVTGLGSDAISFEYSDDRVSMESGLDGATVFSVNASQNGTCTLPLKISSPQYTRLMEMANNNTMFAIWCTDKSTGRKAGGSYAMFSQVPGYTADGSDITFNIAIADLTITTC